MRGVLLFHTTERDLKINEKEGHDGDAYHPGPERFLVVQAEGYEHDQVEEGRPPDAPAVLKGDKPQVERGQLDNGRHQYPEQQVRYLLQQPVGIEGQVQQDQGRGADKTEQYIAEGGFEQRGLKLPEGMIVRQHGVQKADYYIVQDGGVVFLPVLPVAPLPGRQQRRERYRDLKVEVFKYGGQLRHRSSFLVLLLVIC